MGLIAKAVEFWGRSSEGALLLLRSFVNEGAAVLGDRVTEKLVSSSLSERES
jgi:hypothetical protein